LPLAAAYFFTQRPAGAPGGMTHTPHGVVPALHSACEWHTISLQLSEGATTRGGVDGAVREAAWLFSTAPVIINAPNINNKNGRFDMATLLG
jgi:hypothetical protein